MSTAVALPELRDVRETSMSNPLDEVEWQTWAVERPPEKRSRSAVIKAVKWASIIGLLALGGLWSRVTPFEVMVRFVVDAGAIVVMARSLLARHYAGAFVCAAVAVLYNPLAPLFYFSGAWQRAALVASAAPFLASLIWHDMRTHRNAYKSITTE
jgi:hypothetical protein